MTSQQLRTAFLNFFKSHGHTVVPSSSLLPDDPSVLLTTAGMQQFKPYYTGQADAMKDFQSLSTASVQKCFRTSDIEEVGDERHGTLFEMLGNFSFGGYFKKEAIAYALNFLKSIGLVERIDYVTVFAGDATTPFDRESYDIWKSLGIPENKIRKEGRADNFWGPTGTEGPCGPTTEIYVQGIEIWNIVFNQYYQKVDGTLDPLKTPGVDTGLGLDRLAMVMHTAPSIFDTDLHQPVIKAIAGMIPVVYKDAPREYRIITDHIRSACFLIADGVLPSNLGAGYVLRRIIRRMIRAMRSLGLPATGMQTLVDMVIGLYSTTYPELKLKANDIASALKNETEKFTTSLERGLKEFERIIASYRTPPYEGGERGGLLYGASAFMLYESYGFPFEMTQEMAKEQGIGVDAASFQQEMEKHKEVSKVGMDKKDSAIAMRAEFQGVNTQEDVAKVTRYHTAAHLMHAALQKVLGPQVKQMGSNITPERMRFDFTFARKVTPEEIKKVEDMVNEQIKNNLQVSVEETTFEAAVAGGAHAFFKEKYPPKVTVYSMGTFSKEVCGGPHVAHTGEVGTFKIIKEEASSAGVRRIRASIEP